MRVLWGFPGGSAGKESACSAGDPGLTPGSGRSPGEGNDNPLQYSGVENPKERILVGYSPWGRTESDMTEATEHTRVFAVELRQQIETRGRKQDGCGKGMIWERVWFLEAVLCCPFLLFFLFLWFYDCILVVARQH